MKNLFQYERKYWNRRCNVIGVDEVGRGSFAGPLVSAACMFSPEVKVPKTIEITDSKKLTKKQREIASVWIVENCSLYSIVEISANTINKIGVGKANILALRRAAFQVVKSVKDESPLYVFSDYFSIPHLRGVGNDKVTPLGNGDAISFSIAAASILAKVYRDNLMKKLGKDFPLYGWDRNCGYGTREHREMIKKHGPTHFHRIMFIRNVAGTN